MDANGIADRAGPRGAGSTPVQYPFTLFQGPDWGPQFKGIKPVEFELQTIPQSGKSWNIDEVGTAHYGMVADYVEEIRIEGGREGLDALYNSRSEEHTSEIQSLMRISYAVFCLKKNKRQKTNK